MCSVGQLLKEECNSETIPYYEHLSVEDKQNFKKRVEAAVCRPLNLIQKCCLNHFDKFYNNYVSYQRNEVGCCNPMIFHKQTVFENLEEVSIDLYKKVRDEFPFILPKRFICPPCKSFVTGEYDTARNVPRLVDETYSYEQVQALHEKVQNLHGTCMEKVLRPLQAETIHHILNKKDVLCVSATNSGKTLIMIIPSLILAKTTNMKQVCIIVSPLVTLMEDLVRRLEEWNLVGIILKKEELINGSVKNLIDQTDNRSAVYLIASPEILDTAEMRKLLLQIPIHQIQIDEGHMTVIWGESFRETFKCLANLRFFSDCPLGIFTATFQLSFMPKVIKNTGLNVNNLSIVSSSPDRPEIYIDLRIRGKFKNDYNYLKKEVDEMGILAPRTLIFTNTIDKTSDLNIDFRDILNNRGRVMRNGLLFDYYCDHFSSSTEDDTNKRVLEWFADPNSCLRVLFSTISYGLGLDNKTISRVVIHDIETDPLTLWQKCGRCSRSGQKGTAILYSSSHTYGSLLDKKGDCIRNAILSKLMGYDDSDKNVAKIACSCMLGTSCQCKSCFCCSNCKDKCPCQSVVPVPEDMDTEENINSDTEISHY